MSEDPPPVPDATETPVPVGEEMGTGSVIADDASIAELGDEGPLPIRVPKTRTASSDTTASGQDVMRKASAKIANLRAAFEHKGVAESSPPRPPPGVIGGKRFEKSPARSIDREAELTRLRDELEKETEMRRIYEEKCSTLQTELATLRGEVEHPPSGEREAEWEQARQELERSKAQAMEEASALQQQLVQEQTRALEEASALKRQMAELKRSITSTMRTESQVTDSHLAQEMSTLYHETQNWVVTHFRRAKMDKSATEMCACLDRIAEPKQLQVLRPVYEKFNLDDKLAVLQTTTVCYMMEIFEEPLLFGMPSHQEWRKGIRRTAEGLPSILTPVAYNRWRSMTLDAIRNTEALNESVNSAATSMAEMICITLTTLTEVEDSQTRIPALKTILGRAIQLAHLFRVQRAQYEFKLPRAGSPFDVQIMEEITVDGASPPGRFVKCTTFPSVTKMGDENGDNVHFVNAMFKAKVLCRGT